MGSLRGSTLQLTAVCVLDGRKCAKSMANHTSQLCAWATVCLALMDIQQTSEKSQVRPIRSTDCGEPWKNEESNRLY